MYTNPDQTKINKIASLLANSSHDYINYEAIYSDETGQFVSNPAPLSNESITISIRVAKDNIDAVFFVANDKEERAELIKTESLFDYYSVNMVFSKKTRYHFVVKHNEKRYFYNKKGLHNHIDHQYDFMIIPDFDTPKWAKGAVMYQIFVDRFYNGDKTNDVVRNEYAYLGKSAKGIEDWNEPVSAEDVCNFYGGDLQGVIDKMQYLKSLNIDAIYFNPIFVSPSNHKYDIQDYDYIDPHYGVIIKDGGNPLYFEKFHNRFATMYMQRTTDKKNLEASNQLFIRLVEAAHENGIRVILDGVFNHCGAFNKWLDRENFYGASGYPQGAYREQNSVYHKYFRWYDEAWPNNECYDSWWGHDNHPKLFYENSQELYDYIIDIAKKWVSPPYNADGWRLDVGADLGYSKEFNHKFWRDFRIAVKSANPDAIILAEHYGDPADWLDGTQWDSVMNYDAFMEPITWFLTGMEKHSESYNGDLFCNALAFENSMRYYMSRFSYPALQIAMNELSNHDHSRFLTRTNLTVGRLHTVGAEQSEIGINKGIMMEAVMLQMFWPGAPTVYYGDEVGVCGWTDPDNRRVFPWGREDTTLLEFHREMTRIHKENAALINGSLEYLYLDTGILSFGRWYGNNRIVCVVNNNAVAKKLDIPVWKIEVGLNSVMSRLIFSGRHGFICGDRIVDMNEDDFTPDTLPEKIKVNDGILTITLPPYSGAMFTEIFKAEVNETNRA